MSGDSHAPRSSFSDKGDVTFSEMLAHPSYFEYFRQFVCSEFSEQNVLFYLACNTFKDKATKLTKPEMLAAAQRLCTMYIGDDALLQVNLSKDECKGVLEDVANKEVNEHTFEKPKKAILKLMERDSWKRFEKTPIFKTLRLLRETPTILKPKTAQQQAAVRQSSILVKSFQIASNVALDKGSGFTEDFYQKLFLVSPETSALLSKRVAHQARAFRGAMEQLLSFMQPTEAEKFNAKVDDLAKVHLAMGITGSMFHNFGKALIDTLRVYLLLDEDSPEWEIIERHWTAAFEYISKEIMKGMRGIAIEKGGLFKKNLDTPSWLLAQLEEYHQYTSLTLIQIGKVSKNVFADEFYDNFFRLSPMSKFKFSSPASQKTALFGAIESVVKLLKKPKKMSRALEKIARTHRDKGISTREYMMYVRALRVTFRKTLGKDYNEKTDTVWKQFLELVVMFSIDGAELAKRGDMSSSWVDIWENSEQKDTNAQHLWNAINDMSDGYSTGRDSSCSESDSLGNASRQDEPEIILDLAYFQRHLPGMSVDQINIEIDRLNEQLIYCTSQLRLFGMQELQAFCQPATAALLGPFTKDGAAKVQSRSSVVSVGAPNQPRNSMSRN